MCTVLILGIIITHKQATNWLGVNFHNYMLKKYEHVWSKFFTSHDCMLFQPMDFDQMLYTFFL